MAGLGRSGVVLWIFKSVLIVGDFGGQFPATAQNQIVRPFVWF